MAITDDKVVEFRRYKRPEPPLTAEEKWFVQLIKDVDQLPAERCAELLFAACDTDKLADISAELVEYLEWARGNRD